MTALHLAFLALLFAQVLDAWTTVQALKRPGRYEANRALRWLADKIGVGEALFLAKAASCAVIWVAVLNILAQGYPRLGYGLLGGATALYLLIAYQNHKLR